MVTSPSVLQGCYKAINARCAPEWQHRVLESRSCPAPHQSIQELCRHKPASGVLKVPRILKHTSLCGTWHSASLLFHLEEWERLSLEIKERDQVVFIIEKKNLQIVIQVPMIGKRLNKFLNCAQCSDYQPSVSTSISCH